jgi:hypothetical protein
MRIDIVVPLLYRDDAGFSTGCHWRDPGAQLDNDLNAESYIVTDHEDERQQRSGRRPDEKARRKNRQLLGSGRCVFGVLSRQNLDRCFRPPQSYHIRNTNDVDTPVEY